MVLGMQAVHWMWCASDAWGGWYEVNYAMLPISAVKMQEEAAKCSALCRLLLVIFSRASSSSFWEGSSSCSVSVGLQFG